LDSLKEQGQAFVKPEEAIAQAYEGMGLYVVNAEKIGLLTDGYLG
jgi:hypothetical protein